jgi:diguanylate cyclase (GGDEF)-like protein
MNGGATSLVELFDAFGAGIYVLFGAIHLDLWLKRRDRSSHLWLAVASWAALVVDLTGLALRGTDAAGGLLPLLNLMGVAAVVVALRELVIAIGSARAGRLTRVLYPVVFALAIVAGFFGLAALVPLFFVSAAAILLFSLSYAIRAGVRGDRESRAIAIGLIILITCLVADVLKELKVIEGLPGLPIVGFAALFLISARSLSTRYEREHQELVALRNDLEARVVERTRELAELNSRLEEASRTDALTRLPNRRGFLDVVAHELRRSARAHEPCTVLMIDLDHFKQVNDRHGHAAGDALLEAAASLLRAALRAEDVVARWGGEEFIVLLPNTDASGGKVAAEKLRMNLAADSFQRNGFAERITASFGIAQHEEARPFDATIAAADDALYRAKERGRNRIEVAGE